MVLKILAHARKIVNGFDAERLHMISRPNTRQHQKLRRSDRACRQQNLSIAVDRLLAAVLDQDDATGTTSFNVNATNMTIGEDGEVRASLGAFQVLE